MGQFYMECIYSDCKAVKMQSKEKIYKVFQSYKDIYLLLVNHGLAKKKKWCQESNARA